MERTSRGGGRVWTNLNESYEMRRNGEKFSWDLKLLKIQRDDKIPRDFSPINVYAAPVSEREHLVQDENILFPHKLCIYVFGR